VLQDAALLRRVAGPGLGVGHCGLLL
jgi:hypothetical protein